MATIKRIELFFQEGSSDKVYNAEIEESAGTFTVHVEWGRRGSRLNTGDKAVRVTRAAAEATLARLVREKTGKGYEERTTAHEPAAIAPPEGQGSGSRVTGKRAKVGAKAQLLTAIDDDAELARMLADAAMLAQQKLDGVRVLVTVGDDLIATNRDGQITQLAGKALDGLAYLPKGTIVDGEVVGDAYWLFDVLELAGDDVRARGYFERWQLLDGELEPALTLPSRASARSSRTAPTAAPVASVSAGRPRFSVTEVLARRATNISDQGIDMRELNIDELNGVAGGMTDAQRMAIQADWENFGGKHVPQLVAAAERPIGAGTAASSSIARGFRRQETWPTEPLW